MNKSLATNLIALIILALGYGLQQDWLLFTGLFALSGALTNWLAIHMLFEKVPGLYGSGIIPNQFEAIKRDLHQLIMQQFFSPAQIDAFLSSQKTPTLHLSSIIEQVDLTPAYDKLVETIMNSSFGGMLSMFGGADALTPLKAPFIENMKASLIEMTEQEHFHQLVQAEIEGSETLNGVQDSIDTLVQQRINELTPELVKQLVQQMIQQHLGWLVVWGGVFGGLLGALSSLFI